MRATDLIREANGSFGHYTFAHALIRETLYAELPAPRRAPLHRRVAEVLERTYGNGVEAHVAELAYHFAAAGPDPDGQAKALTYSRQAGDRALQRFAYEDAVRSYERALDVLAAQPSPDEGARCELLLAISEAQMRAGDSTGRPRALVAGSHAGAPARPARALRPRRARVWLVVPRRRRG